MWRLRNGNDKPILDKKKYPYLCCAYNPSKPMIHHIICEKNCKKYQGEKYNDCIYYKDWYYSERQIDLSKPTKKRRK